MKKRNANSGTLKKNKIKNKAKQKQRCDINTPFWHWPRRLLSWGTRGFCGKIWGFNVCVAMIRCLLVYSLSIARAFVCGVFCVNLF